MKYISLLLIFLIYSCKNKNTTIKTIFRPPSLNNEKYVLKIYKTSTYAHGKLYREEYDTIKTSNKNVDIQLLYKNLHHPDHLPDNLKSNQYKDTAVTVWRKPQTKENHESNWSNTYTYDSLGRLTNYTYSPCLACSDFNFDYILTYDKSGRVNNMKNKGFKGETYKIYYNETGDVKQLDEYSSGEHEISITLIK